MGQKFQYEDIRQLFQDHGCTLLSKEYIDTKTALEYRCKCGNIVKKTYGGFIKKPFCKDCYPKPKRGGRSLTEEELKKIFSERGCELLEEEYISAKTPMKFRCECGNVSTILYHDLIYGQRCSECGNKRSADKQRLCLDDLKEYYREQGCELLETEYINSQTPMRFICSCGNEAFMAWCNFRKGKRCMKCGHAKAMDTKRRSIEEVRKIFQDGGCELLSTEYQNPKSQLAYICNCGKRANITLSGFMRGSRCPSCKKRRIHETRYANGTTVSSTQQRHICLVTGGELNYPLGPYLLDIAFPAFKVYIEYDGSGHDLAVKKGDITQGEFQDREQKRNYYMWRRGWKCIRIISKDDKMPTNDSLVSIVSRSIKLLKSGKSYVENNLDTGMIVTSDGKTEGDFGELAVMRKDTYDKWELPPCPPRDTIAVA